MPESLPHRLLIPAGLLLMRSRRLFPFLNYVYGSVFERLNRANVFLIKGVLRNSDRTINMLFVGDEASAYQLSSLTCSRIKEKSVLGRIFPFQIDPVRMPNVEVAAVHAAKPLINRFLKQGFFLLPCLKFSLDLHKPMGDIVRASSGRRRKDIKKIGISNYSYIVSRKDEKRFEHFYRKMYLPYMKKRFGKAAILRDYLTSKLCYYQNGGIIFVTQDKTPIAGILFQIKEKTLYALSYGVRDDEAICDAHLAGQAALLFLIKWARTEGLIMLNYGTTVPFFRDGAFEYKKQWGMHLEEEADMPFCVLKFRAVSDSVLLFLQQNPFIFLDGKSIKGVFFVDHQPSTTELDRIVQYNSVPKLDSLIVIAYDRRREIPTAGCCSFETFVEPLKAICLFLQKQGYGVTAFERPA
jgi:hypothetical protein